MLKKIIPLLTAFVFSNHASYWQQEIPVSGYLNNSVVFNPAFAGSREIPTANLIYKTQFTGFSGNSAYQSICFHLPVSYNRIGLGGHIYSGKSRGFSSKNVMGYFSYRIRIMKGFLSAGTGIGIYQAATGYQDLNIRDRQDPTLDEAVIRSTSPDISLGLSWYNQKMLIGISGNHMVGGSRKNSEAIYLRKLFNLVAARNFTLSHNTTLTISTLTKMTDRLLIQSDLTCMLNYRNLVRAGTSFRTGNILSFQGGASLRNIFRGMPSDIIIFYAFDYPINAIRNYTGSTHEIQLSADFIKLKKPGTSKPVTSPLLF